MYVKAQPAGLTRRETTSEDAGDTTLGGTLSALRIQASKELLSATLVLRDIMDHRNHLTPLTPSLANVAKQCSLYLYYNEIRVERLS